MGDGVFKAEAGGPAEFVDRGRAEAERQRTIRIAVEIIIGAGEGAAAFDIKQRSAPGETGTAGQRRQSIDLMFAIDAAEAREAGIVAADRRVIGVHLQTEDPLAGLPIQSGLPAAERTVRLSEVAETGCV